jgi:hypothetical protein
MNSSPTIVKIASALVKAQSEMSNAVKGSNNPFFKKAYADINAIREAVLPALNLHGITAIQPTTVIDGIDYVETILLHESGEFISSLTRIVVDKVNDAQRHGSGLSYARRYALQSICNIGAEDDDANKATGKKETVMIDPDVVDALTVLDAVTDLSELAGWKKTFEPVLKDPAVKNAAIAKHSQLKTEAK